MPFQISAIGAMTVGTLASTVEGAVSWLEAYGFSHDVAVNLASDGAVIVLVSMLIVGTPRLAMLARRAIRQRSVRHEFDGRARVLFIHHLLLGAALTEAMRLTRFDENQPYWERSKETLQNFEPVKRQASEIRMHYAYLENALLLYSSHLGDEFFSMISARLNPARKAAEYAMRYSDQLFAIDTEPSDLQEYLDHFRLSRCFAWCYTDEEIRRLLGSQCSNVIAALLADKDCKAMFLNGFGAASDRVRGHWSHPIETRRSKKSVIELLEYVFTVWNAATPVNPALPGPIDKTPVAPAGVPVARKSRFILLPR